MGNGNRVKVAGVKLAEGKVRPLEEPPGGGCRGGVRFWGTAAQIEPACSTGKQKLLQPH